MPRRVARTVLRGDRRSNATVLPDNKVHRVRDVVYHEDAQHACAGTGAQVVATVRNLALGLLRLAGITPITRTPQRIAADRTRVLPYDRRHQGKPTSTFPMTIFHVSEGVHSRGTRR